MIEPKALSVAIQVPDIDSLHHDHIGDLTKRISSASEIREARTGKSTSRSTARRLLSCLWSSASSRR